jgi:hypothetical protein
VHFSFLYKGSYDRSPKSSSEKSRAKTYLDPKVNTNGLFGRFLCSSGFSYYGEALPNVSPKDPFFSEKTDEWNHFRSSAPPEEPP